MRPPTQPNDTPGPVGGFASPIRVETMGAEDLAFAVDLHRRSLPEGFFASLGPSFLAAYLRAFLDSPHAVGLLARHERRPLGVLVGSFDNERHQRWVIRRRGLRLAMLAGVALLGRPRLARHFLRTRWRPYLRGVARRLRPGRVRSEDSDFAAGGFAVLSHISVVSEVRGRGVGRSLERAFVGLAQGAGAREARLGTLAGAAGAGLFYEAVGWRRTAELSDLDERSISLYALDL